MRRLLALIVVAGCAAQRGAPVPGGPSTPLDPTAAGTTATPTAPAPEMVPPSLRLPVTVRPVRYRPALTVVPGEDTFNGTIEIDLDVLSPASVVWLNAQDLTIQSAEARIHGTAVSARALPQPKDYVGISFATPLPAGDATLRIAYSGRISRRENAGVFQTEEGGTWYVSTHFEPIDARRAYPCFDEPSFKVPWQLSLRIKSGQQAFSNTPIETQREANDGFHTVTFAQTRPLPSYLTAFAVGPWQRLDAGKA
ncbi:MAG TPA: M1 family peptidase, partial [Myxococcales bacterium]|nr:M1 family peptidase [Myxococcales bacterium]